MEQVQKAVIVGVDTQDQQDFEYSMEELRELAFACDLEVVGQLTQKMERVNNSHYIGTGKVKELLEIVADTQADMVIFNDELSPSQIRNLESELECTIIDRTILILDIFAKRARTREAQLQVSIAQLQYMLPRLVGLRASLSRQGGSGGVGFSNRGLGETKLELDRRRIEGQISSLKRELEVLVGHRQTQRKLRKKQGIPVVALVGYTNAGKSTLLNAFMDTYGSDEDKQVYEKDMLFATLETAVRNVTLSNKRSFLLTDTVGFVSKLPHHLIKAFRSTLEEVKEADLLIHVVDSSNENHQHLIDITAQTLEEIGIKNIPVVYAYNKADLVDMQIPSVQNDSVFMSAKQKIGIHELTDKISEYIFQDYVDCELLVPYDQGEVVSYFNQHANIMSTSYEEDGTKLVMECKQSDYEKFKKYLV